MLRYNIILLPPPHLTPPLPTVEHRSGDTQEDHTQKTGTVDAPFA